MVNFHRHTPRLLGGLLWVACCGMTMLAAPLDTRTGIVSPDFRTLEVKLNGEPQSVPVLAMGTDDHLTISFDGLTDDRQYLRYSLVHCNADWQPSALTDAELFPEGFNYGDVEDFEYSRGTTVHYVRYLIILPNDHYRLQTSGNYLLRVYPENDPDDILLQARFMVAEPRLQVSGHVLGATDVDYRGAHQQLEIAVDAAGYELRDMFNDLRLVVMQNQRTDNAVMLEHPSRVQAQRAIYEHLPQLIFPAGNEYRRMETVSTTYPGMHVDHIDYHDPYYYHVLETDGVRAPQAYSYDQTQHGRRLTRLYGSADSDVEADYTVTLFTLDMGQDPDCDIYIEGDLTDRRLDSSSRMAYDSEAGLYQRALLLKQGAYNYQYLAIPRRGDARNGSATATVEGDHYQTRNEYLVLVYYRPSTARYDRLLGATLLTM